MARLRPNQLGLPARYTEWRKDQFEATQLILRPSPRFEGLNAPTGFGKTMSYVAGAVISGMRTLIYVATRALADQIRPIFEEIGMVDIRGQHNYLCNYDVLTRLGDVRVDEGPCHEGVECKLQEDGCEYFDRFRAASGAEIVLTNYAYGMSVHQGTAEGLRPFDLLVLDEAHLAADQITKSMEIVIPHTLVENGHIEDYPFGSHPSEWQPWFQRNIWNLRRALDAARSRARVAPTAGLFRAIRRYKHYIKKFQSGLFLDRNWIVTRGDKEIIWQPIWPGPYAESRLFLGIPKVVLVSATLRPRHMDDLHIKEDQRAFTEFDSSFPVFNRTVVQIPTVRVDAGLSVADREPWLERHVEISGPRGDRRGLVHPVSFPRGQEIAAFLRARLPGRTILDQSTGSGADFLKAFEKSRVGTVGVRAALTTGIDLPDDACRYQIISKIPFPPREDPVVKARTAEDRDYANFYAATEIQQIVGRDKRHDKDWSECFIIDDHFRWFFRRAYSFWSGWFREAVRISPDVPPPPNLLTGP